MDALPTSNLAPFYGDYVSDYLGRAQGLANMDFTPFTGDRFAGPSSLQQQAFSGIGGLTASPYFGQAGNVLGQAAANASAGSGYTPTTFNAPGYTATQMVGPGGIGPLLDASNTQTVQGFMNPYTQSVTDIARRKATDTFLQQQQDRGAAAAKAGAFGGSRHGVLDAMALRDFNTQLNDIQMQGGANAFNAAQQALQAQRSTDLNRLQSNQQMDYNTVLQNMQAANQAQQFSAGQNLTGQQLSDQSRQAAATQYNQGIQSLLNAGTGLGNLATASSTADANRMNQMLNAGAVQQQFAQQPLDFGYQQWQQSLQFPYQQAQFQQSMLQGLPLNVNQTAPSNALLEGLMGAGGIYNLMFGGN